MFCLLDHGNPRSPLEIEHFTQIARRLVGLRAETRTSSSVRQERETPAQTTATRDRDAASAGIRDVPAPVGRRCRGMTDDVQGREPQRDASTVAVVRVLAGVSPAANSTMRIAFFFASRQTTKPIC